MKVLWFEVTAPHGYNGKGHVLGGWQDSLERVVKTCKDIELVVSFESRNRELEVKIVDGVKYIPLTTQYSSLEKIKAKWDFEVYARKIDAAMQLVVESEKPDLIHVFGAEWPFGRIAKYTDIPVVVHIMGSMVPYVNALYAPGFSFADVLKTIPWWNVKKRLGCWSSNRRMYSWRSCEEQVWQCVKNYMGRTDWDYGLSNVLHPGRKYFHVEEALRQDFLSAEKKWVGDDSSKIRLFSTGCSNFWKGPDMLLKTARILTQMGVDFEWNVAGQMNPEVKKCVEKKLGTTFAENNVRLLGFVQPDKLSDILCGSSMYVHTAYIENSPNSICEAQCLGVPVVSTNVGGIGTLVRNGVDGVLVPANDPWQMANAIVELARDKQRASLYSSNAMKFALERHSDKNILDQLLACYRSLV